jgi:hypothetical protein
MSGFMEGKWRLDASGALLVRHRLVHLVLRMTHEALGEAPGSAAASRRRSTSSRTAPNKG